MLSSLFPRFIGRDIFPTLSNIYGQNSSCERIIARFEVEQSVAGHEIIVVFLLADLVGIITRLAREFCIHRGIRARRDISPAVSVFAGSKAHKDKQRN